MDLERLIKKIRDVNTNIAIYTDQLQKHKKELSTDYDLDIARAKIRLEEIEKRAKLLQKKKKRLYTEAERILKGIKRRIN